MDELDLHRLADETAPSGLLLADPRPVEVVIHRSRQIRRRRRGAGVVGAAVLLAIVVAARALAPVPQAEQTPAGVSNHVPKLCTRPSDESWQPASYGPSFDRPPPGNPGDYMDDLLAGSQQPLPPAEVSDLVLLPGALPEGMTIGDAVGGRLPGLCPAGPLLSLDRYGSDGAIAGTIRLRGPYAALQLPLYSRVESYEPIPLRGGEGRLTRVPWVGMTQSVATWTDARGITWLLEGLNVDEATLRAVAEALVLDAGGSPPADLPGSAVPEGWTVRWRAPGPPTSEPDAASDVRRWSVDLPVGGGGCSVTVSSTTEADAPVTAEADPGDRLTTVHGQEALMVDRVHVDWNEPSGARVSLWCLPGYDGILDLAESLSPPGGG